MALVVLELAKEFVCRIEVEDSYSLVKYLVGRISHSLTRRIQLVLCQAKCRKILGTANVVRIPS